MYTSGSSGTPKGIGISHRAIISLLYNTNYIQITAADRIAQASNASFDAATFEIWGALLYGAQIVGVEKETLLSERRLVEHIQKNRISILFVTTALFNQIAREFPQAFKPLRCLLFGGEAVNPHWVKVILAEESPQQLLHMYGPTETTTFATWHAIATVEEKATTIPIGKPLTNTQVYVVDAYMQLLPVGIPGELYIGGTGLARGYISNPELTAEYFIPDPFSQEPGARLYKTGDLVRYLPTGEIEYLSRLGQQVKLRGYRIELAEIEAVISRHPAIQEIAVIAREDRETDKYLAAYLVLKPACVLTAQDLQTYLQAKLPDYMIPSAFAYLSALPLNPNGKVDRRNLPVPEMIRLMPEGTYVAPQTPQEESLARIWTEILGLEQVGIYDNFFKLGGHSLLATQITSRIRTDFHVDLPLRVLFDTPTIDGLARAITTRQQASSNVQETHIKPLPRKAR
jgi:acyl-coenzyme A synthetase/AMP-(fatty) acid ligase